MSGGGQTIRFATAGDRTIAWAATGSGPPLVLGGWWMSHLELDWAIPEFRALAEALGAHRTVIRYDRPGVGLSDHGGSPPGSLDDEVELLGQVVDAVGDGPVALLGASSGGPVAAAYAARNPGRVDRLVLYGSYADGAEIAPPQVRSALILMVGSHWGLGSRVLADLFLPGASPAERDDFARFQRASAAADIAAASLSTVYEFDVRDELPKLATPTLVLHRRDDRAIAFRLGRELATRIPGAVFQPLDGAEHFPWRGDVDSVRRAVLDFLGVTVTAPQPAADAHGLSQRELDVLCLVATGLGDAEIAERLVLSPHTVHRHVANIRTKLGLPSRAAAAAYAVRAGLI